MVNEWQVAGLRPGGLDSWDPLVKGVVTCYGYQFEKVSPLPRIFYTTYRKYIGFV